MPKALADEAMTDLIAASEEEPSGTLEWFQNLHPVLFLLPFPFSVCHRLLTYCFFFLPADLPQASDDFDPSMDATFDDASDEFIEAEGTPPVVGKGIL